MYLDYFNPRFILIKFRETHRQQPLKEEFTAQIPREWEALHPTGGHMGSLIGRSRESWD